MFNVPHGIDSTRRPAAPTVLFHVRERNLATELSLWPGQSCGTVYQQQFVMRTVWRLFKHSQMINSHFLVCVLVINNVMPFSSLSALNRYLLLLLGLLLLKY